MNLSLGGMTRFRLKEIGALAPERICISPGPCTPREAGISKDVILAFGARTPILGVCLGHQCIAEAYGGEIVRASRLMHGKASTITHNGNSLFSDLATSFEAGRYHSLVVKRTSLPGCLEITAESDDGEIMALCHREFPVYGVQFHPESVLTHDGKKILARFLDAWCTAMMTQLTPTLDEFARARETGQRHPCFRRVHRGWRNASFSFQETGPRRLQFPF